MYLITWITTHLPTPEGWMAKLAMLAECWPIEDGLTTKWSLIQLAVWRRIGKVRRPTPAF